MRYAFVMMLVDEQREICRRYGADFLGTGFSLTLGLARDLEAGQFPLHGLRHPPQNGTCGWFIWTGDLETNNPAFFAPVHVSHLQDELPLVLPYLGLAPGWRFLLAPRYEDVWFDRSLLSI